MGDLSAHFSRSEFACRHCGEVRVDPILVCLLEELRERKGRPLRIISGYRCPVHNRAVGGARRSYHVQGQAVDIPWGYATEADAEEVGFLGVGLRAGWAVHLDIRSRRARWRY